jgi:hypothetical protein
MGPWVCDERRPVEVEQVALTAYKEGVNIVVWGLHAQRLSRCFCLLLRQAEYTGRQLDSPYVEWDVVSQPRRILFHPEPFREGYCNVRAICVYERDPAGSWVVVDGTGVPRVLRYL